jgi:hypothetical protein
MIQRYTIQYLQYQLWYVCNFKNESYGQTTPRLATRLSRVIIPHCSYIWDEARKLVGRKTPNSGVQLVP